VQPLFTLGLSILQSSHQVVTVVEINLPQSLLRKKKMENENTSPPSVKTNYQKGKYKKM